MEIKHKTNNKCEKEKKKEGKWEDGFGSLNPPYQKQGLSQLRSLGSGLGSE